MFDTNDDGMLDFDEFRELNRRFPLVLFPAFRLQDQMQKVTFGGAKWAKIMAGQNRYQELEHYVRAHHGNYPRVPTGERLSLCLTCRKSLVQRFEERKERLNEVSRQIKRAETPEPAKKKKTKPKKKKSYRARG